MHGMAEILYRVRQTLGVYMSESDAQATQVMTRRSTGIMRWQKVWACLEWTADDRIRVSDLDADDKPGTVVFDSPVRDITKARHLASVGNQTDSSCTFKAADSKVNLLSLENSIPMPGPEETVDEYNQRVSISGVPTPLWWIERLESFGVDATYWGFWKLYGLAAAAGLVGCAVLAFIVFLVTVAGH